MTCCISSQRFRNIQNKTKYLPLSEDIVLILVQIICHLMKRYVRFMLIKHFIPSSMPSDILYLLLPFLNKYTAYFYIVYLIGYCRHFSLVKRNSAWKRCHKTFLTAWLGSDTRLCWLVVSHQSALILAVSPSWLSPVFSFFLPSLKLGLSLLPKSLSPCISPC